MNVYTFHRDGGFYPLELKDDAQAVENAKRNPGTVRVLNALTGEQVYPERRLGTATLIQLRSRDGFWVMNDNIGFGKLYVVDLNSVRNVEFINAPTGVSHTTEVIDAQDGGFWLPFPVELLDIHDYKKPIRPTDSNDGAQAAGVAEGQPRP